MGHECLAAENGEEAWRIFSRTPGVDVVVGDLKRLGEEVGAEEVRAVARELEGFAED